MYRGSRKRTAAVCAALALLILLLAGCTGRDRNSFIVLRQSMDPYAQSVSRAIPGWPVRAAAEGENPLASVKDGNIMECYDVQAILAMKRGGEQYWYPQCLATVIFAVDPNRTDKIPQSWEELACADQDVGWPRGNKLEERLAFGAMAFGMGENGPSKKAALDLLGKIHGQGHLKDSGDGTPITVMMDYQAAELLQEGRNLVLVVPEEGTLSYAMGVLSGTPITHLASDQRLRTEGLRLLDGSCQKGLYLSKEKYARAEHVEDMEEFFHVTEDTARDIRREALHTRLYTSADRREHIVSIVLMVALVLIWTGSAVHRAVQERIQKFIFMIGIQVVLMMCLRLIKYQLPVLSTAARYCWYGSYIFQIGMPLTLLFLASCIGHEEERQPRWLQPFTISALLLLLLTLTNDVHGLVFRFGPGGDWDNDYSYGPGYILIYAWSFAAFAFAFFLLIRKSMRGTKKMGWILPVLAGTIMVTYTIGYALKWPIARDSEYTMTFCALVVLIMETTIHAGLIPANTQYRRLFTSSPLKMQILNQEGKSVLASPTASRLPPVLRVQLCAQPGGAVDWKDDALLLSRAIRGGTVVWEEDIRQINELRRKISASVERLQAANELLRSEGTVRRKKLDTDTRRELFDSLEGEVNERLDDLSEAIDNLPRAVNRDRQLAYITLLLCHIKRRCNLFFLARENRDMAIGELSMYLDELAEFAGYAGITALVRCSPEGIVPIRAATLCYDFAFLVLAWAVEESRASVLGQLELREDGLEFRVLSSEGVETLYFPQSFRNAVGELGGKVTWRNLDEETGLYLNLPGGTGNE